MLPLESWYADVFWYLANPTDNTIPLSDNVTSTLYLNLVERAALLCNTKILSTLMLVNDMLN